MRLVARDRELGEVVERVEQGRRLVTILGPGGVGKTALARAAVVELASRFPMGAHVVDLSRIDRQDAVSGALAAQLGFASFDVLLESPTDLPALVLADNCEHVAAAAAESLGTLLDACAAVTLLATSRSPLAIPGESIVALAPLPVPAPGSVDIDVGAVRLFRERARDSGVEVDVDDLDVVAELCRWLDGVPLAIEIAAARLRVLSLDEVLRRLSEGIAVLSRPSFRGAVRHRSVGGTIEWSVGLLDDGDRSAFACLGVCSGPFSSELAAAVLGFGSDETGAVDVIERLADASLVVVDGHTGPSRYRMLEPIRAVANERLRQAGEIDDVRERLAAHVVDDVSAMLAESRVRWDADILPRLFDRFDQIDVALRHCLGHDSAPERALLLYALLWGMVHQARVDEVLALGRLVRERWPDPSVPYGAEAAATFAMAHLLCGHVAEAKRIASGAVEHSDGSIFGPVTLQRVLGLAARLEGDHVGAAACLADAAAAAAAHGVATMELECQTYRAQDFAALGRHDEALEIVRTVAVESRRRNSIINEIWARSVEAEILLDVDLGVAERAADEMLVLSEGIGYPFGMIANLQTLAACHLRAGAFAEAATAAERLLDAVSRNGAGDFRRALDVTVAVLDAAGHPAAIDLAATAAELPDTNPMIVRLPVVDRGRPRGQRLDRPAATRLARSSLRQVANADGSEAASSPPGAHGGGVFVRSGDVWEVGFGGITVHVHGSKGMEDLAVLLARPGREVHCVDLAGAGTEEPGTGEVIDATARRRYERRVRELQATVDEAEGFNDWARAEQARAELDALVDHLTAALSLDGRTRRQGGTVERTRSAVTHRIRSAIRRISKANPALGRHLDVSLTTGTYCCYRPEAPTTWRT